MSLQWLGIFRPLNLLFLALTQALSFIFLANTPQSTVPLFFLITGTLSIAAAGYMVNDYYDQIRDGFNNKPKKGLNLLLSKKLFWPIYALLNLVGLLCALVIQYQLIYIFAGIVLVLFVYSYKWKDVPVLGNLSIAFIVTLSILLVRWVHTDLKLILLLYYGLFAFFCTWIREMVKDLEDYYGDMQVGAKNLIQILGIKKSLVLVRILTVFVMALLFSGWSIIGSYFTNPLKSIVLAYGIACLLLPLAIQIIISYQNRPDYGLLSAICKYVMLTGVLSMLFF